jgi:hypothetical protein
MALHNLKKKEKRKKEKEKLRRLAERMKSKPRGLMKKTLLYDRVPHKTQNPKTRKKMK